MTQRFKIYGFNYTFVDAVYWDSELVKFYGSGKAYSGKNLSCLLQKVLGCYAGHIAAIRRGLQELRNSKEEPFPRGFFVAEDDILFHNDFFAKWLDVFENLPVDTTLLSLTFMYSGRPQHQNIGKNLDLNNLRSIDPKITWGAQMYWVSERYAHTVLQLFDRPLEEEITSEVIIQRSQGAIVVWPLVIEDGIDSDRAPEDLPFHASHFSYWGWENFKRSDPLGKSPLSRRKKIVY